MSNSTSSPIVGRAALELLERQHALAAAAGHLDEHVLAVNADDAPLLPLARTCRRPAASAASRPARRWLRRSNPAIAWFEFVLDHRVEFAVVRLERCRSRGVAAVAPPGFSGLSPRGTACSPAGTAGWRRPVAVRPAAAGRRLLARAGGRRGGAARGRLAVGAGIPGGRVPVSGVGGVGGVVSSAHRNSSVW